jgi:hypothetical protein
MPIGAGSLYSGGALGGSKDAVVVSHTHTATVSDPEHSHAPPAGLGAPWVSNAFFGDGPFDGSRVTGPGERTVASGNTQTAKTNISVSNSTAGESGTNANLPPYLGIFFIIKT